MTIFVKYLEKKSKKSDCRLVDKLVDKVTVTVVTVTLAIKLQNL